MTPTADGRHVLFRRARGADAGGRAALWETDVASGRSRDLVSGDVAAMATLRRPDLFKVAVAGAPVADLRDDDALKEVFCGPVGGPDGDEASLLTWARQPPTADRPARPLLLIHGTGDDNVHVAHSIRFAAAMGAGGRPLEFFPLLAQTHRISSPDVAAAASLRTAAHLRAHLHGPACER